MYLRHRDLTDWEKLKIKFPIPRTVKNVRESYLSRRCDLAILRIKAQIRLANEYNCSTWNGLMYRINPRELCTVCN